MKAIPFFMSSSFALVAADNTSSGGALIIQSLPAGPHKILIELVDANHKPSDSGVVNFVKPNKE